jgi:hypothetical protein
MLEAGVELALVREDGGLGDVATLTRTPRCEYGGDR